MAHMAWRLAMRRCLICRRFAALNLRFPRAFAPWFRPLMHHLPALNIARLKRILAWSRLCHWPPPAYADGFALRDFARDDRNDGRALC